MSEKLAQFASSMNRTIGSTTASILDPLQVSNCWGGKSWQRHQRRTNPISEMDFRFAISAMAASYRARPTAKIGFVSFVVECLESLNELGLASMVSSRDSIVLR